MECVVWRRGVSGAQEGCEWEGVNARREARRPRQQGLNVAGPNHAPGQKEGRLW